jgi:malonyl-CoA decarboxylase
MSQSDRTDRKTRQRPQPPESAPNRSRPSLGRMLRSLVAPAGPSASNPTRAVRQVMGLCTRLMAEQSEPARARLANEVLQAYQALDSPARGAFFDFIVTELSPDPVALGRAADAYRAEPSQANLVRLQAAVESPRQELFRRCNMATGGTAVLVRMRAELLATLDEHPERTGVDADFRHLFRSWFNRGFLYLQRIDWRTSALVLERLIEYEAVHEIRGWRDLRRRLEADRRCYAFFHPALPDEPLIFIEVALVPGMQAKVQPLLDPDAPVADPARAECALFYSITNCQQGLRGISFGSSLIKQVADELGREFPRLKTFSTLSPVPGFGAWLMNGDYPLSVSAPRPGIRTIVEKLRGRALPEPPVAAAIQAQLTELCAYYLMHAKRDAAPLDPVARFHLANGARLERINWMGDTSDAGLTRSVGFTVNYVYRLADIERNHGAYAQTSTVVASSKVERLAANGRRANRPRPPLDASR